MATSRITELAAIIDTNTKQVDHYLASKGLPSPSFDPDSPPGTLLDNHITTSRQAILSATDELHALMQGPMVDALIRWPESEEPNQAGFNIAHNTDVPIFDELAKYSDRGQRFADAMTFMGSGPGLEHHHILNHYDWASLGASTVVDVGGSHGSLSIAIAQAFPSLRCIVQDRPEIIEMGDHNLPTDVRGRVDFMAHDFFDEQPVKDAEVYILRWILHDWSDRNASRILKALVPALQAGARVLLLEQIMPEPGALSAYQERAYRSMDLVMWATHNAKERTLNDWRELLKDSDPGLEITSVIQPKDSRLSIIEAAVGQR
ncbi:MAG: hypothetical protein LQ352_004114 [Teloschistes flavicans]|nr:MAG: hypothetical protein LQ352_004114 [Teloschistes flavicans]